MKKQTYITLLRDPRWQKKRLEILQRDNFTCRKCKDETITLHIHHTFYRKQETLPWDYPDKSLITLCENCHEYETAYLAEAKQRLIEEICCAGYLTEDIIQIAYNIYRAPKILKDILHAFDEEK